MSKSFKNNRLMHFMALSWVWAAGCSTEHINLRSEGPKEMTYNLATDDVGLSLLADPLAQRLSNVSFDIFVKCGSVETQAKSISNYTLGSAASSYTVTQGCANPEMHMRNVRVDYKTVNATTPVTASFTTYGNGFSPGGADAANELVFEMIGSASANGRFQIRERKIAFQGGSPATVTLAPKDVTVQMISQSNHYCSGASLAVNNGVLSVSFDMPESGAIPSGSNYNIVLQNASASGYTAGLPTGAVGAIDLPNRLANLNFQATAANQIPGKYAVELRMTPTAGSQFADEQCTALIKVDLQGAPADFTL
jgi:hypothetical protein